MRRLGGLRRSSALFDTDTVATVQQTTGALQGTAPQRVEETADDPFEALGGVTPRSQEQLDEIRDRTYREGMNTMKSVREPRKKSPRPTDEGSQILDYWRGHGYVCLSVQTYDTFGKKHDIMGFGDYLAIKEGGDAIMIQACTITGLNEHIRKICSDKVMDGRAKVPHGECFKAWVSAPNRRVVIHVLDTKEKVDAWLDSHAATVNAWDSYRNYPYRANRKWHMLIVEVTMAEFDRVAERRRK